MPGWVSPGFSGFLAHSRFGHLATLNCEGVKVSVNGYSSLF